MKQRQCMFSFPEGDVLVTFPEPMSVETVETLDECLRLLFRGWRRRALAAEAVASGEAEYLSWDHSSAGADGVEGSKP